VDYRFRQVLFTNVELCSLSLLTNALSKDLQSAIVDMMWIVSTCTETVLVTVYYMPLK